jgi:hypothetical protein
VACCCCNSARFCGRNGCVQRNRGRLRVLTVLSLLICMVLIDKVTAPCHKCATLEGDVAALADYIATIGASNNTSVAGGEDACELLPSSCLARGFEGLTNLIAGEPVTGTLLLTVALVWCSVVMVPAWPLAIGSGAAFAQALGLGTGVAVGGAAVFVGLSIGALLAFSLARYLLYDAMQRQLRRWRLTKAIDAAVRHEGLKVMLLLRSRLCCRTTSLTT